MLVSPVANNDRRFFLDRAQNEESPRRSRRINGINLRSANYPAELGMALLGIAKTRHRLFFFISFVANFLGILAIGFAPKSVN